MKIARAWGVLQPMLEDIARVLDHSTIGNLRRNDDDTWSAFFTLAEPPAPEWGVLLGDYAHNLRSALDNLVTVLVVRNGKLPVRANSFPIYLDEAEWRNNVARHYPGGGALAHVARPDYDLIESVQPFIGRDRETASDTHLGALARINNADKHAAMHVAFAYQAPIEQSVIKVSPRVPVEIVWTPQPFTHLQDGAEMTRLRFPAGMPRNVKVGINWPLAVRFLDYRDRPIRTGELIEMHREVVRVVGMWDDVVAQWGADEPETPHPRQSRSLLRRCRWAR